MEQDPEMKITAVAADIHLELTWNKGEIDMVMKDVAYDIPTPHPRELKKTISAAQGTAIIALFVDGGENMPGTLQKDLYRLAEEVLVDVPQNLRPIP